MKIETSEEKAPAVPFPKLMKNQGGTIALFTEPDVCVIIKPAVRPWYVGQFYTDARLEYWSDYHGTVTLSN